MARTKKPIGPFCVWMHDQDFDFFDTDCGEAFQFIDGSPKDNGLNFCCYCGRKLKVKEPK